MEAGLVFLGISCLDDVGQKVFTSFAEHTAPASLTWVAVRRELEDVQPHAWSSARGRMCGWYKEHPGHPGYTAGLVWEEVRINLPVGLD